MKTLRNVVSWILVIIGSIVSCFIVLVCVAMFEECLLQWDKIGYNALEFKCYRLEWYSITVTTQAPITN